MILPMRHGAPSGELCTTGSVTQLQPLVLLRPLWLGLAEGGHTVWAACAAIGERLGWRLPRLLPRTTRRPLLQTDREGTLHLLKISLHHQRKGINCPVQHPTGET